MGNVLLIFNLLINLNSVGIIAINSYVLKDLSRARVLEKEARNTELKKVELQRYLAKIMYQLSASIIFIDIIRVALLLTLTSQPIH